MAYLPNDNNDYVLMLRAVFDSLPDPIFVKNSEHQWIYGNAPFKKLIQCEDFLGKDDRILFPEEQVKVFWGEDEKVFAGASSLNEEQIGEELFALTKKFPIKLPDGSVGLVGIIFDISTYKERLERLGDLKKFLPQNVAELIVEDGTDSLLEPKRRLVTVCVIDLRGFTAFSETADPEEVVAILGEFYTEMGKIVDDFGGTVEHFAGDSMTIFFNAPLKISSPESSAVRAASAMREGFEPLRERWLRMGHDLGLGMGLANGYATIGAIGFEGRWQYAAIGAVTNLASRLCAMAAHGEILMSLRLADAVGEALKVEEVGAPEIKGFHKSITVVRMLGLSEGDA